MEWRPIETAPKDGTEILVACCGDVFTAMYWKSNDTNDAPFFATSAAGEIVNLGIRYGWSEYEYRTDITHWMPLPQPPEDV